MYFHTGQVLIMENRVPPADGAGGRRGSGRRLELYINRKKNVSLDSLWSVQHRQVGVWKRGRLDPPFRNGGFYVTLQLSWVGNR